MVPPSLVGQDDGELGTAARTWSVARLRLVERVSMQVKPLLRPILNNEALTRGLADPEARMLVEWLVDRVERLALIMASEAAARAEVHRLCRRARSIGRFVTLWCHLRERGSAIQLAGAERFTWPLPTRPMDPCELMQSILHCEASGFAA